MCYNPKEGIASRNLWGYNTRSADLSRLTCLWKSGTYPPSFTDLPDDPSVMGGLTPIAFDIETSGLDTDSVITVAGLATEIGAWLALNTRQRPADMNQLTESIERTTGTNLHLTINQDEVGLLQALRGYAQEHVNGDRHYVTAYHGETWNGGFDLPFLRSACVRCDIRWPFPDVAYADVMTVMDRFETGDSNHLVGVYEELVDEVSYDPFDDSEEAVAAYEAGEWRDILLHNLADVERTRELAVLAGHYVPKSDFCMKNLTPPDV